VFISKIKQIVKSTVEEKIKCHIRLTHQKVKPIAKQGLFNHKCHQNSLEYCSKNDDCKIVFGICIDESRFSPNLHCWVVDSKGDHLEVTLGHEAEFHEYYQIKTFMFSERGELLNSFDMMIHGQQFITPLTNWFERFVLRNERVL